jgi:UDP-N-acetylglucosamine 3-dehydrogenase
MSNDQSRRSTAVLRAGLVGLGSIGRHHARVLRSLEGVELVAVADPDGDPAGAVRGMDVMESVEEVIAGGVDMCVVAVPTDVHEVVAVALAEAGVPTLVEKPLAPDLSAAWRIVDAFARRGLIGAVGHIERYNPALQAMRARIDAGELGGLYQVATRRQGPFPTRVNGIGVVLDLASHDIDITTFVTGSSFRLVTAMTASKSGRSQEDLVAFLGQLHDGTVSSHLVNWLSPLKERIVIVTGERGCFVADTLAADLTFFANASIEVEWDTISMFRGVAEGDVVRYAIPKPEPLQTELAAFRDAVAGRPADLVSLEQGASVVSVAESVLESATEMSTVSVPTIAPRAR